MDERLIAEIEADARATAGWTGRAILSAAVLEAMRATRREAFMPPALANRADENTPVPIGCGQTISQPFIVALMTDLLNPAPDDVVLEIGAGSGYQAAVLSRLAAHVFSIEIIPELAERAAAALAREGCRNVTVRAGDGAAGWPEHAPFHSVIVTAAAPRIPDALMEQLRPGGRLVAPVGPPHGDQTLIVREKNLQGEVTERSVLPVSFVPLTGKR